jgi:predicted NUDIX family phosphoesterase
MTMMCNIRDIILVYKNSRLNNLYSRGGGDKFSKITGAKWERSFLILNLEKYLFEEDL